MGKRRQSKSDEDEEDDEEGELEEEELDDGDDDESSLASDDLESEQEEKPAKKRSGSTRQQQQRSAKRQRTQQKRAEENEEEEDEDEDDSEEIGEDSLYIDAADRSRLMKMSELEREMILAERAEERDKQMQRQQLLQTTRQAEEKQEKGGTRNQRLSGRQKQAANEKESAIKRLEEARKRKEKKRKDSESGSLEASEMDESEEDAGRQKRKPSKKEKERQQEEQQEEDEGAAAEEEGTRGIRREEYDEDDQEERRPSKKAQEREEEDEEKEEGEERADYDDLRAIQLSRTQLENMHDKLFFEGEGLAGTLVRMAYGGMTQDSSGQSVPMYMLMQVVSIQNNPNKPYPFGPKQGPCTKYLQLEDGVKIVRTMPMTNVSNQPLTEAEIERYWRHRSKVDAKSITKSQAEAAKKRIADASQYRWDSSKVRELLEKKRAAGAAPVNMAAEKAKLRRMLEFAQANNNAEEVATIETQLRELDEKSMSTKNADSRTYGMTNINKRNQEANFNLAFKNVSNKPANAPQRKGGADPFSRRETRPNISWATRKPGSAQEEAARAQQEAAKKAAASAAAAAPVKLKGNLARMDPAQLIQHLNIDIDVTPLQEFSVAPPLAKRLLGPRWDQSLRRNYNMDLRDKVPMSVADWKIRAAGQ